MCCDEEARAATLVHYEDGNKLRLTRLERRGRNARARIELFKLSFQLSGDEEARLEGK